MLTCAHLQQRLEAHGQKLVGRLSCFGQALHLWEFLF